MLSNVDDLKDVLSRELSCFKALDRWIILLQIIQRVEASRAENQHKTEHIHIDDYDRLMSALRDASAKTWSVTGLDQVHHPSG